MGESACRVLAAGSCGVQRARCSAGCRAQLQHWSDLMEACRLARCLGLWSMGARCRVWLVGTDRHASWRAASWACMAPLYGLQGAAAGVEPSS